MATHIADPRKRLIAIIAASNKSKAITGAMKSVMPTDMPSLGLPWLLSIISPLYKLAISTNRIPVVANIVISNVPGPPVALFLAGVEWFGHRRELADVAVQLAPGAGFADLARRTQFDCSRFSNRLRRHHAFAAA